MDNPFYFRTRYHLVRLLGVKAKNAQQLLEHIKKVPQSSIYYHTHRFLQQHSYLSPEPPNDFAYWITNILNLKKLGESFNSVDIVQFRSLEKLRSEFIRILESYCGENDRIVDCPEGHEFHFMACKTFVLPTPWVAHDLGEFASILEKISPDSLYFHIFEARMRLKKDENDFSEWFRGIGEAEIAEKISSLDPYNITLEGLRKKLIHIVREYA